MTVLIESQPLSVQTVQAVVAAHLRQLILSGQLAPGARLIQDELAMRLGVSRTPIREALYRLAHEGLVTFSSYKGASVAQFSMSDLEEIYSIRTALESYATCLAAQRISTEALKHLRALLLEMADAFREQAFEDLLRVHHQFHASIYAAAGERRLTELTVQYLGMADVYQRMALSLGRGAKDPVIEHEGILTALIRRDADEAERLMRTHLRLTASELSGLLAESPLSSPAPAASEHRPRRTKAEGGPGSPPQRSDDARRKSG